jgi:hypothetical protein
VKVAATRARHLAAALDANYCKQTTRSSKTVAAPEKKTVTLGDPVEENSSGGDQREGPGEVDGLFKTKNRNQSWKWKEFMGKRENSNPKKWLCISCYK